MEDWLKCQISSLVKYRQHRIRRKEYSVLSYVFASVLYALYKEADMYITVCKGKCMLI